MYCSVYTQLIQVDSGAFLKSTLAGIRFADCPLTSSHSNASLRARNISLHINHVPHQHFLFSLRLAHFLFKALIL